MQARSCCLRHVLLDPLPDEQDLPAAKRPEVVDTFQENRVLEPFADGANVVLNPLRKFFCREIGLCHNNNLDTLQNDLLPLQNDLLCGHYAQE